MFTQLSITFVALPLLLLNLLELFECLLLSDDVLPQFAVVIVLMSPMLFDVFIVAVVAAFALVVAIVVDTIKRNKGRKMQISQMAELN